MMEWNPMRAPDHNHSTPIPSDRRDGQAHFTVTLAAKPSSIPSEGQESRSVPEGIGERKEFRQPGKGVPVQFSGSLLAGLSADPMGRRACVRP